MAKPRGTAPKGIAQTLPPMSKNPEAIEARARELLFETARQGFGIRYASDLINGKDGISLPLVLRAITAALQSSSDVVEIAEGDDCICKVDCPMTEDGHWINCPAHFRHANYLAMINPSPASNGDYVVVPREPTEAMLTAGIGEWLGHGTKALTLQWRGYVRSTWSAMLAAAPASSAPIAEGRETCKAPGCNNLTDRDICDVCDDWVTEQVAHDKRQREAIAAGQVVLQGQGDGTYDEACDAIRALIDALNVPSDAVSQSQMVELAEALKPFADLAAAVDAGSRRILGVGLEGQLETNTLPVGGDGIKGECTISVADLIRARAALASLRVNEVAK